MLLQGSQASFLPQSQQLVEQWDCEPPIMLCFQVSFSAGICTVAFLLHCRCILGSDV